MREDIISYVSIYTRFFYTQIQYLSETSTKSAPSNGGKRFKFDDDNLAFELDRGCLDKRKYTLRSGWKLHMYISQLPCNLFDHILLFVSFICCYVGYAQG